MSAKYKFASSSAQVYISARRGLPTLPWNLTPITESWCQGSFLSLLPLLLSMCLGIKILSTINISLYHSFAVI